MLFTKMHGCGNDYIFVEARHLPTHVSLPELSCRISDRHRGVGSDGLVVMGESSSPEAHLSMRIFNADGSEAQMCGNAARCVARYALDHPGLCAWNGVGELLLETKAGIRHLWCAEKDCISVDMGPVRVEEVAFEAAGKAWKGHRVDVGNPHCVLPVPMETKVNFRSEEWDRLLNEYGTKIEHLISVFPERTNVEWVQADDAHHVWMRVWERGSGETMACGTGAVATAAAMVAAGKAEFPVRVSLLGGELIITQKTHSLVLTGPAETVCRGEW